MSIIEGCYDGTFMITEDWLIECVICGQQHLINRNLLNVSLTKQGDVIEHYFFGECVCEGCGENLFFRTKVYEYPKGELFKEDYICDDVHFVKPPVVKKIKASETSMYSDSNTNDREKTKFVSRRINMARRKPYSRLNKSNQIRADHVKGMGDVVFKGFQCLNPDCTEFIFVREDEFGDDFSIECPVCGYTHESGGETKFFDYSMDVNDDGGLTTSVATGSFTIFHDEYVAEAKRFKYCIVCNTIKPLEFFDHHSSRKSKRQGECRLCKKAYNEIKNGTRLSDQHREAAQKRRLLLDVAGSPKIDSQTIEDRYEHKCFCCGKSLKNITDKREKPLDHTLPVYYLWPLSTENATLLCRDCNGEKSGRWPSEYYDDTQLKRLAILTGIEYDLLAGKPQYNPEAIAMLRKPDNVDGLLIKYAAYMPEVIKLRNRILRDTGFDFFSVSTTISDAYVRQANELLK